ncbi:hypothetical protein F5Y17DRAFT_460541 [Xylariaceae sp. FL0594]|nr:hypothetical protein F5Y17DRAFT_460541 [Xylariaceae sp. FL0594]
MVNTAEVAKRLKEQFVESAVWELERVIGSGLFGVVVLVRLRRPEELQKGLPSRAVLKRAIGGTEEKALIKEVEMTKKLRGSAHIVQMYASADEVSTYKRRRTVGARAHSVSRAASERALFATISRLRGPALLLEYLPNGPLSELIDGVRFGPYNEPPREPKFFLPNRLLWRILACLVRACLGLGWPPNAPPGKKAVIERPRKRDPTHPPIQHRDIHARNIVFGDFDPEVEERTLRPLGEVHEFTAGEYGKLNTTAIPKSCEFVAVINPYEEPEEVFRTYKGIKTTATAIVPPGPPRSRRRAAPAPAQPPQEPVDPVPFLDEDLRMLLVRQLAQDRRLRPSIAEMYELTDEGLAKTVEDYPGREQEESDDAIREILDRLMLNPEY